MDKIKIIQLKNKYNYTILQLKINYTKKKHIKRDILKSEQTKQQK